MGRRGLMGGKAKREKKEWNVFLHRGCKTKSTAVKKIQNRRARPWGGGWNNKPKREEAERNTGRGILLWEHGLCVFSRRCWRETSRVQSPRRTAGKSKSILFIKKEKISRGGKAVWGKLNKKMEERIIKKKRRT